MVEDDRIAGPQHWGQGIGDVGLDASAVRRAIGQIERAQAGGTQRGGDSGRLVVPLQHGNPAALAAQRPSVATDHVRRGSSLVEEHRTVGVEGVLAREPVLLCGLHVRPLLLDRVERPLLRVMRWRAKKRDNPLVLVVTPRLARAAHNSCRQIVGWAS